MKQFIVGPVEMYPSTKNILEKGYTYFRTQEYGDMAKECLSKVAKMMGAENSTTIYLGGDIITEIDGKLAFADATGNLKAKEELLEIRKVLLDFKSSKEKKNAEV